MEPGALIDHLHAAPGGLKGLVASVRAAKRGAQAPAPTKAATQSRRRLTSAPALAPAQVHLDDEGLAVVIVRREADGTLAMVAALEDDDRLVERVLNKAAKAIATR